MKKISKLKTIITSVLGIGTLFISNFKDENKIALGESIINDGFLSSVADFMSVNNGTISMLYSTGTVVENNGNISQANGTIYINNAKGIISELQGSCLQNMGTITACNNGMVGTNSGKIERINSGGVCTVNDKESHIDLNVGIIKINNGIVGDNYNTIEDCCNGIVTNNMENGTITFTNGAVKGIVRQNYGKVFFTNSTAQIEVTRNYGTVTINGGNVQVVDNYGNIRIEGKTNLYITNNYGTVEKIGEPSFYACDCVNNYGVVTFAFNSNGKDFSTRKDYETIKFVGDDGKATITSCDATIDGVKYTSNQAKLQFTLPDGYFCDNKNATRDAKDPNLWSIYTRTFSDETEYEVVCHKCHSNEIKKDSSYHWYECDECGSAFGKDQHVGEFVSNNDLTCKVDETKTFICSTCSYEETITVTDSHLISNKHNPTTDVKVEPTYKNAGLTEGSHCADCGKILVEQHEIPCLLDGYVHVAFSGLEETPTVTSENITCDLGIFVKNNTNISFKLDKDYACTNTGVTSDENNVWTVLVKENDVEDFFNIECHKCAFSKKCFDANNHWFECIICGRKNGVSAAHSFSDYVLNGDATCVKDGTKTRNCTDCQYSETVTDFESSKKAEHSNFVIDPGVEATSESTGLTEGSHCANCGFVIIAQEIIPKLEKDPEVGSGNSEIVLPIVIGTSVIVAAGVTCGFILFKRRNIKPEKEK